MQGRDRVMRIDVCDYQNNVKCNLYDNAADISGQAVDVHIKRQRNGWKELSFTIPSTCMGETGYEENYRLAYLIPDYRLRVISNEDGEDYYLITEEGVQHEAFAKNEKVVAGHISQLLKNRAMDLEFSDSEGNNVGTADALLATILEGTGWKPGRVATFYEDDGETVKIRSMNAPVKTGAFRLIEQAAELFEAKPRYNGDYTVDLFPMNPFSRLEPGEIPDAVYPDAAEDPRYLVDSKVIELHYDKEIKKLGRTRKTDGISTRLYGYGSYGDTTSKYCSLQTAKHDEYIYTIPASHVAEFQITDKDGVRRYFTAHDLREGDTLIWSMLDPNSRSYVWDEARQVAYEVYDTSKYQNYTILRGETVEETNYFPYLSDYTYYRSVGLLSNEAFQNVAKFQRDMIKYYKAAIEAQEAASTTSEKLSRVGVPKSGYLKLDVEKCNNNILTIRQSDEYPDGVIYRSDYLQQEKNYFRWDVAQALKANGTPVSSNASIIYVIDPFTNPVRWQRAYLKEIDGRQHTDVDGKVIYDGYDYQLSEGEKPHVLTLWSNLEIGPDDEVYLFSTDSTSGKLGDKLSEDEAAVQNLTKMTRRATVEHPVLFIDKEEPLPEINFSEYGWCYRYDSLNYDSAGVLYFSWPARNDTGWLNAYVQDTLPDPDDGAYLYHTKYCTLWHCEDGEWIKLETVDDTEVAKAFGVVFQACRRRDMIYKGLYENYYYQTQNEALPQGNYAMPSAFGYYWLFTTDRDIAPESELRLDTVYGQVYQDTDIEHIVTPHCYPYDTLIYPEENDLSDATMFEGSIDPEKGIDVVKEGYTRSNYIPVWPNETYDYILPENTIVALYDANRNLLGHSICGGEGSFSTNTTEQYAPALDVEGYVQFKKAAYIRIAYEGTLDSVAAYQIRIRDYDTVCFYDDIKYSILFPITHSEGDPVGINSLMRQFLELTNRLYLEEIPALQAAQNALTAANDAQVELLGDILREGWWQDGSYVEGDEQRMYNDAFDNLKKISWPDIEYTFDFLHLYGSTDMSIRDLEEVEWPEIYITDAAHLVDPELNINQWGYLDEVDTCYDKQWETNLTVNTQLTLMGQHEFKDVLTRIAEVASETKAKQTLYQRAENISSDGTINAEQIEGTIDTSEVKIAGSGFTTDENGNFVMESSDGLSALMFNGSGLHMANSRNADGDWEWRNMINGFGLDANTITAGEVNGRLIKANSIRADSLMANVGNELDIGSNKALNLYATLDGNKPAGALKTTDGVIQIIAGSEDETPAWRPNTDYITGDSVSYGNGKFVCLINHKSASSFMPAYWKQYNGYTPAMINIGSGGSINLVAGGDDPESNKDDPSINIKAGGSINLEGGTFTVKSGKFSVDADGNVVIGGGTGGSARVGGWYIGSSHIGDNANLNASKVGLTKPNGDEDVVFWAGNVDSAQAPFRVHADGSVQAANITLTGSATDATFTRGSIQDTEISNGSISGTAITNSTISVGDNFNVSSTGAVTIKDGLWDTSSKNASTKIEDGKLTATGASVTGALTTNSTIGGIWTVDETGLLKQANGLYLDPRNNQAYSIWVGVDGAENAPAWLKREGDAKVKDLTATGNASVGGTLSSTGAGTFGSVSTSGKGTFGSVESSGAGSFKSVTATEAGSFGSLSSAGDLSVTGASTLTGKVTATATGVTHEFLNLKVNGAFTNASSRDVKENIEPLEPRPEAFDQLEPVAFNYKNDEAKHFGLIYEDVQPLYPEVCHEDQDGGKGIDYIDLIAVLIKEVQDLRKRVAELERE